jgi:2-methylaconitate cis-trans-isomerase PrpF
MSSAVGPYAYNHGLVRQINEPRVTVRIHNTNTSKIICSTFNVTDDGKEAATSGECAVAGVPGTGAEIKLSFLDPAGSKTGVLLPTGSVADKLYGIEASCVDAANPCVFVRATDLGVDGIELPHEITKNSPLLHRLDLLRCLGAKAMGLCKGMEKMPRAVPKVVMVSKPAEHKVLSGEYLATNEVDIVARVMSHRQPHRAIPLTAATCTAVAATIKGTLVNVMLGAKVVREGALTIGHPSGPIQLGVEKNGNGQVVATNVLRTARPIMEGMIYY